MVTSKQSFKIAFSFSFLTHPVISNLYLTTDSEKASHLELVFFVCLSVDLQIAYKEVFEW